MNPYDVFDMTVVIPVYNAASYIRRCVASLDVQSMSQDRFEVILVNDGSTDKSLELCKDIVNRRNNYVLINQENCGVSAARNAGIRAARGRYIMFVDSDDAVSKWTVERLVRAYEKYEDAVDLITYPIEYVNLKTHAVRKHKRATWLTKTGVYDLYEYPYVAQTTPNVCIRNDGSSTPTFPVGMSMGEDQYFNTEILAKRGVLGYCSGATYYHLQNDFSSSSLWDEPRYAFEDMMKLYGRLVQIAQGDQRMADYAYGLVLYNMAWRLRQNMLSLNFGNKRFQLANYERLADVLRAIPYASWLQSPYLNDVQRVHLMQRFGVVGSITDALYTKSGTHVVFDNDAHLDFGLPNARIYWAVREPEALCIKGFLFAPAFDAATEPSLKLTWDGGEQELVTSYVRRSASVPDVSERNAWHFCAKLPPMDGQPYNAMLSGTVGDKDIPIFDLSFDVCRSNGRRINAHTREFGDRRLTLHKGMMQVGTIKDLPAWSMPVIKPMMRVRDTRRTGNFDQAEVRRLRTYLPKAQKKYAHERIWLYIEADDALAHDLTLQDGVIRLNMEELTEVATRFAALVLAERIISSQHDFKKLIASDYRTWDRIADFTTLQTYVYVGEEAICLEGTPFDE